jgi:aspartyl-tRNA(Asn)/glutamyl-tRNA(Gln) amidotransferase subunit A
VLPLAWSYDVVGPVARTVQDCGRLLEVLAGRPFTREAHRLEDVGVGLVAELTGERCEPYVERALDDAAAELARLGARVERFELPAARHAGAVHYPIQMAEAAAVHGPRLQEVASRSAPDVCHRLVAGRLLPAATVLAAARARRLLVDETHAAMERARVDVLLAPATPTTAPRRDAETVEVRGRQVPLRSALLSAVLPFSQLPGPTLSLPLGEHERLPFGMQLSGRPGTDELVLRVGMAHEAARA